MDWLVIFFNAISNLIRLVDWATVSSIAVVVSAIFVLLTLREMRHTTEAQAFAVALERLQSEGVREARRVTYQLKGKPLAEWSEDEIKAVGVVCHTYDSVGIMVRHGLLDKGIVVDNWGRSLLDIWPIVEPLVKQYRREFDFGGHWDDFEWLVAEAGRRRELAHRKKS